MNRTARVIACTVLAATATWALWNRPYRQYRCARVVRSIEISNAALVSMDAATRMSVAGRNRQRLLQCRGTLDTHLALPVAIANTSLVMGEKQAAHDALLSAIALDRRPELYFHLARVQLELGKRSEAVENFTLSVRGNPLFLRQIEEPLATEISAAAGR